MALSSRTKKSNIVYLVSEGGTKLCRALLLKRVEVLRPANINQNWSIDKFLESNKMKIFPKLNASSKNIVFPLVTVETNLEKWDVCAFCSVLKEACELGPELRMFLDQLKKIRNKFFHWSDSPIDDDKYDETIKKLKVIFDKIIDELNDNDLRGKINDMFNKVETGEIPDYELSRMLEEIDKTNEQVKHAHEDTRNFVSNQHLETRNVIIKGNRGMEEKLNTFIELFTSKFIGQSANVNENAPEAVGIEIGVRNSGNTEMEQSFTVTMVKLFNDEIKKVPDLSNLPSECQLKLREIIHKICKSFEEKGYRIQNARQKCILLEIQCTSMTAFMRLYRDYIDGSLDVYFTELQTAVQTIDCFKEVCLETVMYEDDFLRTISKIDIHNIPLTQKDDIKVDEHASKSEHEDCDNIAHDSHSGNETSNKILLQVIPGAHVELQELERIIAIETKDLAQSYGLSFHTKIFLGNFEEENQQTPKPAAQVSQELNILPDNENEQPGKGIGERSAKAKVSEKIDDIQGEICISRHSGVEGDDQSNDQAGVMTKLCKPVTELSGDKQVHSTDAIDIETSGDHLSPSNARYTLVSSDSTQTGSQTDSFVSARQQFSTYRRLYPSPHSSTARDHLSPPSAGDTLPSFDSLVSMGRARLQYSAYPSYMAPYRNLGQQFSNDRPPLSSSRSSTASAKNKHQDNLSKQNEEETHCNIQLKGNENSKTITYDTIINKYEMTDSKLSTDTGAQNLMDTIGCQISGTLHVDKKRFKFFKDRSTRLLVLSNRVPPKKFCGLYCWGSIYAPTAEFVYSTLELQSANTYEPSDKKGFGLLIMFEKADKKPLKFICAGIKEREEWVDKINKAINEDKNFSQDSAYGSGGSFIGERLTRTSATDLGNNQQQVPNYDEINEETMYDEINERTMYQTNKPKYVEYTHRKERTITDKRVFSRGAKQMANAELQDQASDYENPEEHFYINEYLGKRNYGMPETGTNVKSQSFITSDTTTQGNERFKILAQEAQAKFKSRGTGPQKKQYASPSINEQNTTSKNSQPTISYSANDQDASFISIREGSPCRSMSYLSVASGVSDAVPMTISVRSSRGEEEALYVNTHGNGSIYEKKQDIESRR